MKHRHRGGLRAAVRIFASYVFVIRINISATNVTSDIIHIAFDALACRPPKINRASDRRLVYGILSVRMTNPPA